MPNWLSYPHTLLRVFSIAACLWAVVFAPRVLAQEVGAGSAAWLYQVEQYVPDQGAPARLAAAQRSLLRVLSRTSGLASVPRVPVIADALKNPERYYSKYVYFDPSDLGAKRRNQIDNARQVGTKTLALRFDFQPTVIKQLARNAQLPTWWSRRASTLAWMVLDTPSGRAVVDHGTLAVGGALDFAAYQRGLPVLLPLMDLQDSVQVNAGVIWGKFTDVLDQASQRYRADQYLVGRFSVQEILGERFYTGEWLLRSATGESSQYVSGANIDNVAELGVQMATQSLLDQHLVFAKTSTKHQLVVQGVDTLQAYADLLNYLGSLEFVDAVELASMQQGQLTLRIDTMATDQQLQALLLDDGRFARPRLSPDAEPVSAQLAEIEFFDDPAQTPQIDFIWLGEI